MYLDKVVKSPNNLRQVLKHTLFSRVVCKIGLEKKEQLASLIV